MFYVAYKRNFARECHVPVTARSGTSTIGQIIATSADNQNREVFASTIDLVKKSAKDQEVESLVRLIRDGDQLLFQKRKYCADYKPYNIALGPRSVGFQVTKALILQASMGLLEYNKYLDRAITAEKNDEEIDDFDWDRAWKIYSKAFMTLATRNVSILFVKTCYESIAMTTFTVKLADRLTKDTLKSVIRKISKHSRSHACKRIFNTALWSSIPSNCSTLTVDILFNVSDFLVHRKMKYTPKEMATWFSKKVILYSSAWFLSATGFAIGSYFNPEWVGFGMAALFEGAAFSGVSYLLCL